MQCICDYLIISCQFYNISACSVVLVGVVTWTSLSYIYPTGPYLGGGGRGGAPPPEEENIDSATQQLQVQREKNFSIDSASTAATGANYWEGGESYWYREDSSL